MTRRVTASLAMLMIAVLTGADWMANPPNPYRQPALIALGSGASSAGGFCGALPE